VLLRSSSIGVLQSANSTRPPDRASGEETALRSDFESNRGLCGAFNAQIIKKRLRQTLKEDEGRERYSSRSARRGCAVRRMNGEIIASFPDVLTTPTVEGMRPVAKIMIEEFEKGRVDRVVMIYTDFISMLVSGSESAGAPPGSGAGIPKRHA
jgi:F0F1-type ATP synthase gamma subunit